MRKLVSVVFALTILLGVVALAVPSEALAKGKPQPPPCPCPSVLNGCILVACGSDCVYQCPLP